MRVTNLAALLGAGAYRRYCVGHFASVTGTWLQATAQAWLVYRLTASAWDLGVVACVAQAPMLLLAPLGGIAADRFSRRRILLLCQLLGASLALALGLLTQYGNVQVWQIGVCAALGGIGNAFDLPCRHALVSELVAKQHLPGAVAFNSSLFNAARLVGPALAGVLLPTLGAGACFVLNAFSFSGLAWVLWQMNEPGLVRAFGATGSASFAAAVRYCFRNERLRVALILLGVVSLLGLPYSTLLPAIAERPLGVGPSGVGTLYACSGLGALLGAVGLALYPAHARTLQRLPTLACALLGAALLAFGAVTQFWPACALLVVVGLASVVLLTGANTLVQTQTADELRGRVIAVLSMVYLGLGPLGALVAGALAERVGPPLVVSVGGCACLLAGVSALVFLRDAAPEPATGSIP